MKKFVGIGLGIMTIGAGVAVALKYIFGKKNTVQEEQSEAAKAGRWFFKKEDRKEDETVDTVVNGFTA